MPEEKTHLYLNPVAAERAHDFERFILDVVAPAAIAEDPNRSTRWRMLRADTPETEDHGVVTYAFLFAGGTPEDWDLEKLLAAHLGREEADRLLEAWVGTFVPYPRWLRAIGEPEDERWPQIGWAFTHVAEVP